MGQPCRVSDRAAKPWERRTNPGGRRPNLAKLKRDAAWRRPSDPRLRLNRSGERGFALAANDEKTVVGLSGEHVLLFLEPG